MGQTIDIAEKKESNLSQMNSSSGLTQGQAEDLLSKNGPNKIISKSRKHPLKIAFDQFNSLMVYLLIVASGISFWFQEYIDAFAIISVILINGFIGFWMEMKAENTMNALKNIASVPAKVFRDGKLHEINSENIVVGDLLFLEPGDMISADAKIINSTGLKVNESALTGESMPVEKKEGEISEDTPVAERSNSLFKGTFIAAGNAKAVVFATGMQTELGKIAHMIEGADQSATPLEKKLHQFSRKLIFITLGLLVLIFAVGLLRQADIYEMIYTSIALAVAAIPEGLPIVATLALAQGMLKMAKQNVIVKKLSAVETLGGTTVICTDKTGTLTQNIIEVSQVLAVDESSELNNQLLLQTAILCNTANLKGQGESKKEVGDPLEIGLLKYALKQGASLESMQADFPKIKEQPFSSETKMMATMHNNNGKNIVLAKGAAEEILKNSSNILNESQSVIFEETKKEEWLKKSNELASSGLRVIAAAYKESNEENLTEALTFLGLFGMMDSPAEGVKEALEECKKAGIKVVMITGDHPETANYIAKELNISSKDQKPVLGKEMKSFEELNGSEKELWLRTTVFARVDPSHKLDLVSVFQEKGEIVAMTGDGVNDAPALKKADIGIAMGNRGTQVAQEVSDMILKDDSFSSIVHAIKQGRIIFANIQKFVVYLLSCNMSELFVVSIVALSNQKFQLLPLQILFINLITDVLPALALGLNGGSSTVMEQKPRDPKEPLLKSKQWQSVWIYAFIISICTLSSVFISQKVIHGNIQTDSHYANNVLFFSLILCQLLHVFNMSSSKTSFFRSEVIKNKYVWYALALCALIIFLTFIIKPIGNAINIQTLAMPDLLVILISGLVSLILIQVLKKTRILNDEF